MLLKPHLVVTTTSCWYFIAGVARNCSLPANLTQLQRHCRPNVRLQNAGHYDFGRRAQEAIREAFFLCSELAAQEANHESNSMDI
jgi:hypothetical protein